MSDDQAPETEVPPAKPAKGKAPQAAPQAATVLIPRPATMDHLRSRKKANTGYVDIVTDPDLADAYNAAKSRHDMLALLAAERPDNADVHAELADAIDELDAARTALIEQEGIVRFHLVSLPPHEYDALILDHPPTKKQREQARSAGGYAAFNSDTFPPALLSACLTHPKLTVDEVAGLFKDPEWNQADLMDLVEEAKRINQTRRTVDLGKG